MFITQSTHHEYSSLNDIKDIYSSIKQPIYLYLYLFKCYVLLLIRSMVLIQDEENVLFTLEVKHWNQESKLVASGFPVGPVESV